MKTMKTTPEHSMVSSAKPRGPRGLSIITLVVGTGPFVCGCSLLQKRYDTPEQASIELIQAVRNEDSKEVERILGRGADEVVYSGDEVADRKMRERFLNAYDEKNSLVGEPDGSMTLQVGKDDWPMPIPLVKGLGSWRFDTGRGKDEILNRRIGRNELSVQQVCLAIVDAQREYIATDRNGDGVLEYAQKVISDAGQRNGLYWETRLDEPPSPLGALAAAAMEEGYGAAKNDSGQRRPFYGYYFKLLTSQGPHAPGGARDYVVNGRMTEGFAVVAWPAEYANSGVMTFLVSHHGIVYERNLGKRTPRVAKSMSAFDPDPLWTTE